MRPVKDYFFLLVFFRSPYLLRWRCRSRSRSHCSCRSRRRLRLHSRRSGDGRRVVHPLLGLHSSVSRGRKRNQRHEGLGRRLALCLFKRCAPSLLLFLRCLRALLSENRGGVETALEGVARGEAGEERRERARKSESQRETGERSETPSSPLSLFLFHSPSLSLFFSCLFKRARKCSCCSLLYFFDSSSQQALLILPALSRSLCASPVTGLSSPQLNKKRQRNEGEEKETPPSLSPHLKKLGHHVLLCAPARGAHGHCPRRHEVSPRRGDQGTLSAEEEGGRADDTVSFWSWEKR